MTTDTFFKKLVKFIKEVEGCKLKSYQCPAGVWTVGCGITGKDIVKGLVWTEEEADKRLEKELREYVEFVDSKVSVDLTDNEFIAIVAFVFNVGKQAFATSTLLRHLVKGDKKSAAGEFKKWDKITVMQDKKPVKVASAGLSNRRLAEESLFNKG